MRRLILALLLGAVLSLWHLAVALHLLDTVPIGPPLLERHSPRTVAASSEKPYFVLHVGPPKTATTSIQCGLDELSAELAKEDSYYFVGKRCPRFNGTMANGEAGIPGHHLMMGLIEANPHSRGFEKLKTRMDFHRARGNSIIFSIEAMSNHLEDRPETWNLFMSLFEGWNVRIVVGYRHYFDWIRSMYFQQHIGKKYKEKWPEQRGLPQPSFQEFLEYHLERWEKGDPSNDGHSWGQHLSLYAVQYFLKHFDDVKVFDLHQDGDVLTNFICQMLPKATNMCHRLQKDAFVETGVRRESHSFDADRLTFDAYKSGMLNKDIGRAAAVKIIRAELEKTADLSVASNMACLRNDLASKFLNASLWFESQVARSAPYADVFHRQPFEHEEAFQAAVEKRKFCEIDTYTVLQLPHWKSFISDLASKTKTKRG